MFISYRVETGPYFVPGLPHVYILSSRDRPLFRTRMTTVCCSLSSRRPGHVGATIAGAVCDPECPNLTTTGFKGAEWPVQPKPCAPLCAVRTLCSVQCARLFKSAHCSVQCALLNPTGRSWFHSIAAVRALSQKSGLSAAPGGKGAGKKYDAFFRRPSAGMPLGDGRLADSDLQTRFTGVALSFSYRDYSMLS